MPQHFKEATVYRFVRRSMCLVVFCMFGINNTVSLAEDSPKFKIGGSLTLRDMITQDGYVYIFRVIFEPFDPSYKMMEDIQRGRPRVISYTWNPFAFQEGKGFNKANLDPAFRPNAYILVAKQRFDQVVGHIFQESNREKKIDYLRSLQDEVGVWAKDENVIRAIPAQIFYRWMGSVREINSRSDYWNAVNLSLNNEFIAPCIASALQSGLNGR